MKLCISNIAWSKNQNAKVINLLKKEKIKYLEYAPDLLLNNIRSKKNITDTKKFWKKNKITKPKINKKNIMPSINNWKKTINNLIKLNL